MKRIARIVIVAGLLVLGALPALAYSQIRISQVYGGGGTSNTAAVYAVDYVEIFNAGEATVDIGGWALEYASAIGNWGAHPYNILTFPANTVIPMCSYVLVASSSPGTAGEALPVAPDFTFGLIASNNNGQFALFSSANENVPCGTEVGLLDKVAYGIAMCGEIMPVPALSWSTGAVRKNGGMWDTDDNAADFDVVTKPVPRNSFSPQYDGCLVVPVRHSSWGALKSAYR